MRVISFSDISVTVIWFAHEMQAKLDINSHKGITWPRFTQKQLLRRLRQETDELERAIELGHGVVNEAADVANFAMMIADNFSELVATEKGE